MFGRNWEGGKGNLDAWDAERIEFDRHERGSIGIMRGCVIARAFSANTFFA